MAADNSYEADRRKRVEENMKRMQEFGITKVSQELAAAASPKPYVSKKRKRKDVPDFPVERRTSGRIRNAPISYFEEAAKELKINHPRKMNGSRAKEFLETEYSASPGAREMAQQQAENIARELDLGFKYFIKSLVRSHVSGCYWLGLPKSFCTRYLSSSNTSMILEDDEKNIKGEVQYLAARTGLSGGWKGFAREHGLNDGDAVIFHLAEPRKFKMYVTKAKDFERDVK